MKNEPDTERASKRAVAARTPWLHLVLLGALLAGAWRSHAIAWLAAATICSAALWQLHAWRAFTGWRRAPFVRPPEMPWPWNEIAADAYRTARHARTRQRSLIRQLRRDRRLICLAERGICRWR